LPTTQGLAGARYENMHKNATVAEWYKKHGKHEVFAKGRKLVWRAMNTPLQINAAEQPGSARERCPSTAAEEERLQTSLREQQRSGESMRKWCLRNLKTHPWFKLGAPISNSSLAFLKERAAGESAHFFAFSSGDLGYWSLNL